MLHARTTCLLDDVSMLSVCAFLLQVALVGFVAQHAAYPGTGPVQNLVDHIADPYKVFAIARRCLQSQFA